MAHIPYDESAPAKEIQFRSGSGVFGDGGWRGKNSQVSPGAIGPNEVLEARNVRLTSGEYITRPAIGEVLDLRDFGPPLLTAGQFAPVMWLHPDPSDNPRNRLWMSALGCFGQSVGTGSTIFHVDPLETPPFQTYANFFSASDEALRFEEYNNLLYIGHRDSLVEGVIYPPIVGIPASEVVAAPPIFPTLRFPGYKIRWLKQFDGLLFIGLEALTSPSTTSRIVSWNGTSWVLEKNAIDITNCAEVLQDRLIVAEVGKVWIRAAGDAPGTWTSASLVGFTCFGGGNSMAEFRDKMVIAGGDGDIFTLTGTTLAALHNVPTADAGFGVTSVALHEGLLYYGWNKTSLTFLSFIGRWDPDSTVDAAHEFRDEYIPLTAALAHFIKLCAMVSYRGRLCCGGGNTVVVRTANGDMLDTPEMIHDASAAGTLFAINQMLRFPA